MHYPNNYFISLRCAHEHLSSKILNSDLSFSYPSLLNFAHLYPARGPFLPRCESHKHTRSRQRGGKNAACNAPERSAWIMPGVVPRPRRRAGLGPRYHRKRPRRGDACYETHIDDVSIRASERRKRRKGGTVITDARGGPWGVEYVNDKTSGVAQCTYRAAPNNGRNGA